MSIAILVTIDVVTLEDDEVVFFYAEDGALCYYDEEQDEVVECDDVDYDDAGYAYYFDEDLEVWLYFDDEVDAWVEFDIAA